MKFLLQKLIRHWNLKLLALGLSLLLYIAISGQPRSEVGLTAPIVFRDLPAGMEITNVHLHRVEVRLIGPADLVSRAAYTALSVSVELTGLKPGRHPVYLTAANVAVPFDLHVASIRPNMLSIDLERILTVRLELQAQPVGLPAPGFRLERVQMFPPWVEATGPAPVLARLHGRIRLPLDIAGLHADQRLPMLPASPDPSVRLKYPPDAFAWVRIAHASRLPAPKPHHPPHRLRRLPH